MHGSRSAETNSAIDGMSDRRGSTGGVAVTFYMNEGSVQEVSVRTDGGDAEAQYSGVWMNAIPKEGGNAFNWNVTALWANKDLSASNLSQAYIDQGLTAVNGLKRTWDFNPNGGGPLIKDKLWFYVAYRNNEIDKYVADAFYNTNPTAWLFVPDKAHQAVDTQIHRNYAGRLTWQATPRNKFNFSYEKDRRITPLRRIASTVSPEATTYTPFYPERDLDHRLAHAGHQQAAARHRLHVVRAGLGRATADQPEGRLRRDLGDGGFDRADLSGVNGLRP